MKALLQTGFSRWVPAPPEKRFLINRKGFALGVMLFPLFAVSSVAQSVSAVFRTPVVEHISYYYSPPINSTNVLYTMVARTGSGDNGRGDVPMDNRFWVDEFLDVQNSEFVSNVQIWPGENTAITLSRNTVRTTRCWHPRSGSRGLIEGGLIPRHSIV